MKTTKNLLFGAAVIAALAVRMNVRADDLAAAAAKASALVNRPIAASPHGLEEFPWLLRGASPPFPLRHPAPTISTNFENFATAAAKASALVNRPIAASPHGLEEFPWLLRGASPPVGVGRPAQTSHTNSVNQTAGATQTAPPINRGILPSTHRGDYP
jgi:hypothetical protein